MCVSTLLSQYLVSGVKACNHHVSLTALHLLSVYTLTPPAEKWMQKMGTNHGKTSAHKALHMHALGR